MKLLYVSLFALLLMFIACQKADDKNSRQDPLKVLDKHLWSIANHNLDSLKSTLSPSGEMLLVLPGNKILSGVDSCMAMHKAWFSDAPWRFHRKIRNVISGKEVTEVLVDATYMDSKKGSPYYNKLAISFTLRREHGRWYVVKHHACSIEKSPQK